MLFAFDGTWDDADAQTHVCDFYQAHRRSGGDPRSVYFPGVGTHTTLVGKLAGGVWGAGERDVVDHAINVLVDTLPTREPLSAIGFSRGAATALDFVNRAWRLGYRAQFLGLWDTVAAFGVANLGWYFSRLTWGHTLTLPAHGVDACAHAMALDERRPSFNVTRIAGATEVWFRGCHGDIGGHAQIEQLAPITLGWMYEQARRAGLPIADAEIAALHPNPDGPIGPDWFSRHSTWTRPVRPEDVIHASVTVRPGCVNPPQLLARAPAAGLPVPA